MSKVMVIDDDEQLGRSIARVAQREGHSTLIVEDPRDAESQTEFLPDLVIVELQAPWIERIASLRARLEHTAKRAVPFVFTIGRRELYREVAPSFAALDDWLAKPFDPEELAVRIETAIRRSASGNSKNAVNAA
jgi:DNA-binding response OmpR family regulator